MDSVSKRPVSSQEALSRLEKGTAPPTSQLQEAAQIIGIDLALCSSHPMLGGKDHVPKLAAPKQEWVLRWLLKKLKTSRRYRTEPESFLLFQQLIALICPQTLATTMRDQKFITILNDTITDLAVDIITALERGSSESLPSGSESSQTLAGSPAVASGPGQKGVKRKRPGSEVEDKMNSAAKLRSPASCIVAYIRVLDCLYSLVTLARSYSGVSETSSMHLKYALKGDPDFLGSLLGKSFKVAALIVQQLSSWEKTTDLQHFLYVLPAMLELWELRSSGSDDSQNEASNKSYSRYCFRYALRLRLCTAALKLDSDERAQVIYRLERQIALHVIIPARAAFFDRGGSGIDYSSDDPDWSAVQPVSETFKPFFEDINSDAVESQEAPKGILKSASNKTPWKMVELFPGLFDIAARSVPRDTFRRQTHELAWLETLFVAVAELAFSLAKQECPSDYLSDFVGVLKQLFQLALERKVQLSLHTLRTHATYTGLMKDLLSAVEWELTALLVKLGADIFLPNSGLKDSGRLLDALTQNIQLYWRSMDSGSNQTYQFIKSDIVIPLLRSFATARDLPGFIELWNAQLVATEKARVTDSSIKRLSIWEDDDLCNSYSKLAKVSLTDAQVEALVRATAVEIQNQDESMPDSPDAYARLVLLEATFRKRVPNLRDKRGNLNALFHIFFTTLSSTQALHWRWRLWRLFQSVLMNQPKSIDVFHDSSVSNLVDIAVKTVHRLHKALTKDSGNIQEAYEAFRFVLVALIDSTNDEYVGKFVSLSGELVNFINKISPEDVLAPARWPWNGRTESLDSTVSLALGYFLCLLRNPNNWLKIESKMRQALFGHLLSLAAVQCRQSEVTLETPPTDARYLQAWASLTCHEYLLAIPAIVGDLIAVLTEELQGNAVLDRKLLVESLRRIPVPLFTRRHRGVLLDTLQDVIVSKDVNPEDVAGMISLMAKLAEMPKSTASVTSGWKSSWAIAKAVALNGTENDLYIMASLRGLLQAVFSKLLFLSEDGRLKRFSKCSRKMFSRASKLKLLDDRIPLCDFYVLISLCQFQMHREALSKVVDLAKLDRARRRLFDLLMANLSAQRNDQRSVALMKAVEFLEQFEDLLVGNEEVESVLKNIEASLENIHAPSTLHIRSLISRCVLAKQSNSINLGHPLVLGAGVLDSRHMYLQDQKRLIQAVSLKLRNMPPADVVSFIMSVRNAGFTGNFSTSIRHYFLVAIAVSALPRVEDKESAAAREVSLTCTTIIASLQHCTTVDQFSLATECLEMMLRTQPRCITQWNIDNLVTKISICASKKGPTISPDFAGTVFVRLCRLMGTLLSLFRRKLGGRFQLVLPAMQRLLHCLFSRSSKGRHPLWPESAQGLPHWLAPLQASHAVHFTRLLTSLCDPTVSAVSRSTPSAGIYGALTDETKKAKRIAGQYLQYLVMEYCDCSLRGTLSPEVKTAILPGLYAVLDVMSRDTMRALNAGLDISGRAVFKTLYEDYVKFGKWNKG